VIYNFTLFWDSITAVISKLFCIILGTCYNIIKSKFSDSFHFSTIFLRIHLAINQSTQKFTLCDNSLSWWWEIFIQSIFIIHRNFLSFYDSIFFNSTFPWNSCFNTMDIQFNNIIFLFERTITGADKLSHIRIFWLVGTSDSDTESFFDMGIQISVIISQHTITRLIVIIHIFCSEK